MGYGAVARLFHWVTVLAVLVMVPVGLAMVRAERGPTQDLLFIIHKGLGPIVLLLVLARLAWRLFHRPTPLPAELPASQRFAAGAVHVGLYAALIVVGVSGYVRVTTGGFPLELLESLGIPALFSKAEEVSKVAKTVHATALVVLAGLILAHVAAAAYHGLIRRDGVISRIWPPIPLQKQ